MSEETPKIIVDQDWKAEARKQKEQLEEKATEQRAENLPDPSFTELLNMLAMQALAGMGVLPGPGGERIPPNLELSKHFIDMLQLLEDKTKGNLTEQEQKQLDALLYEIRMRYVEMASGGAGGGH